MTTPQDTHDATTGVQPASLHDQLARVCSERDALRAQLVDARTTLARIRNVATAAHAPLAQCLDWCANEAVLALDRVAPHPPVRSPVDCGAPSWARELAAQAWCTPATSHITLDAALADSFAAILAEDARCNLECSALRSQLVACRGALAATLPILKTRAIDADLRAQFSDADAVLDLVQQALDPPPP